MASRDDLRKAYSRDGREAPVSGVDEHLDHASAKPPRHGSHRNQDAGRNEASRHKPGANPATRGAGTADSLGVTAGAFSFCRASLPGFLHQCGGQPARGGEIRFDHCRRATSCGVWDWRNERCRKRRRPQSLSDQCPIPARLSRQHRRTESRVDRHACWGTDPNFRSSQDFVFTRPGDDP